MSADDEEHNTVKVNFTIPQKLLLFLALIETTFIWQLHSRAGGEVGGNSEGRIKKNKNIIYRYGRYI